MSASKAFCFFPIFLGFAFCQSVPEKGGEQPLALPKIQATAYVPLEKVGEYRMQEARFAAAAVINGKSIYVIGGQNSAGTILTSIERFNIETGESKMIANLAVGRIWAQAVLFNDKIFVFGGQSPVTRFRRSAGPSTGETLRGGPEQRAQNRINAASNIASPGRESDLAGVDPEESVEVIDLGTGAVSTVGKMPEPRSEFGCALVNGSIYVVGGKCRDQLGVDAFTNRVDIFDPVTGKWKTGPQLSAPATANIAVVDESIVLIPGGFNGIRALDSVFIFDPRAGKRGTLPALCRPTSAHAAVCLDKYMFLFGDYAHPGEILAYNLRDKTSETFTLQYDASRHAAAVATATKIFVIGGKPERESAPLNKIQVFELRTKPIPPAVRGDTP